MKKVVAILFLFVFLSTSSTLGPLLRLHTLIHHYFEHAEQDNYSFVEFLNQHYATTINHPDDEHKDHEKLPFKAADCLSVQVVSLIPQPCFSLSNIVFQEVEIKESTKNQQDYSNSYLSSIWHPPRFN